MLWRVRKHGETCWRGVLERSGGLDSGARARPTVDVGAWAVMPRRTREAVHVGADATGGGCARESRSTSERLDCVRECGKQGQQLRARVGEAWGGGEIVRSSHPRTGEQGGGREGVWSTAYLSSSPGSRTRLDSRRSLLCLPQKRASSFFQHFCYQSGSQRLNSP